MCLSISDAFDGWSGAKDGAKDGLGRVVNEAYVQQRPSWPTLIKAFHHRNRTTLRTVFERTDNVLRPAAPETISLAQRVP